MTYLPSLARPVQVYGTVPREQFGMEQYTPQNKFLYFYWDPETRRIQVTGFVSAHSRRDARRRLRELGLRT